MFAVGSLLRKQHPVIDRVEASGPARAVVVAGTLELRDGSPGAGDDPTRQVRAGQVGAPEVSAPQVGAIQIGAREVGALELRPPQGLTLLPPRAANARAKPPR